MTGTEIALPPVPLPVPLPDSGPEGDEARYSLLERIALQGPRFRKAYFRRWPPEQIAALERNWAVAGRPGQKPPKGEWRIWLLMAGRGYGKTRAGAEWVHHLAQASDARIALVGPTESEVRAVMVEGSSGILSCVPEGETVTWEPSRGRLVWSSGAQGFCYSGANPESLRGPEHDFAWCDELAKWALPEGAWDNLMLGLRRGEWPQALVTTTPKPIGLLKRLVARDDVARSKGRTADNSALAENFVRYVEGLYGGTRLGRQELDGELIADLEGSLWPRDLIERSRQVGAAPLAWRRIVVGVDPPASVNGDACGIIVCALGEDGNAVVLADASVERARPEAWARAVAAAAAAWNADRVVAEGNQGGAMVESVLRSVDAVLPVKIVHASHGKSARAEPVAGLFASGRARFAGAFPELEDELSGLIIGGGYEGPGRSPDRADAMVWALTELMLGKPRAEPRVRRW